MGRYRNHRNRTTKNKEYKKGCDTKRRKRDIDQIQDDLAKEVDVGHPMTFAPDEDLPGMGQFYCMQCARHFISELTLENHKKTKVHRRRLKDVSQQKYTQREAEAAAGKTVELLPPAHTPKNPDQMQE